MQIRKLRKENAALRAELVRFILLVCKVAFALGRESGSSHSSSVHCRSRRDDSRTAHSRLMSRTCSSSCKTLVRWSAQACICHCQLS